LLEHREFVLQRAFMIADPCFLGSCSKIWDRELMYEEVEALRDAFSGFAKVSCTHGVSIISLICNVARTSNILERVRVPAWHLSLIPTRALDLLAAAGLENSRLSSFITPKTALKILLCVHMA
jgi:hypothetical protein